MQTTVRLARWDGQILSPWYPSEAFAWDMSQVSVRASQVASEPTQNDSALAQAIEGLKGRLPDKGKWSLLVPLMHAENGSWQGEALDGNGRQVVLVYNRETGLTVSAKE